MHPLKKIRKDMGLTQQAFSKKFNITQPTLSKTESGILDVKIDLLYRLRKYTDIIKFIEKCRRFK